LLIQKEKCGGISTTIFESHEPLRGPARRGEERDLSLLNAPVTRGEVKLYW
jgi:hypothetical protein